MRTSMSFVTTFAAAIFVASCATGRDPGSTPDSMTQDAVASTAAELCQVEIENGTRGELEVYYSAGPERARKLDKIGPGTDLSFAVPCDARYVSVSALGVDGRYAKRADLQPGSVTSIALNQSDRKRE